MSEGLRVSELAEAQQLALMRLHLYVTGKTHELLNGLLDDLRAELLASAGEDGTLEPGSAYGLNQRATVAWREMWARWVDLFQAARRQAVWITLGQLAGLHEYAMGAVRGRVEESRRAARSGDRPQQFLEEGPVGYGMPEGAVFERFAPVMEAMRDRVDGILSETEALRYSDGKNLSDRIWNLGVRSLPGIVRVLQDAAVSGGSAWDAAKKLERYLGSGQDCPRWTRGRLYGRTKTQIASGDRTGLISGSPCGSEGVAYNALRMARNEIQIAHHMATDRMFAAMPWVDKEQIVLSPSHPLIGCECEEIVVGGENGEGIYLKGEVILPVHVQCLCFKIAVLVPSAEFAKRMRGWMQGTAAWPEMDEYAAFMGLGEGMLGGQADRPVGEAERALETELAEARLAFETLPADTPEAVREVMQTWVKETEENLAREREMGKALWDLLRVSPEEALPDDWRMVAEALRREGYELYYKYTKDGIREFVARERGAQESGYMVVGSEQIVVRQGAFSARAAQRMEGELWRDAREAMSDAIAEWLQGVGYRPEDIARANYDQRRRLLEEIGEMELKRWKDGRVSWIDDVPVEARTRVVGWVDPDKAATAAFSAVDPLNLPSLDAYHQMELADMVSQTKIDGEW